MAKFKAKLFFLLTVTLFSLATLILTLFNYNPFKAETSVFVIFYLSLFVTLSGVIVFFILFIKSRVSTTPIMNVFWPSIRQSMLISLATTLLLLLQGIKILDLWVGVPLAIAILLLELFFCRSKFKKTHS